MIPAHDYSQMILFNSTVLSGVHSIPCQARNSFCQKGKGTPGSMFVVLVVHLQRGRKRRDEPRMCCESHRAKGRGMKLDIFGLFWIYLEVYIWVFWDQP